MNDTKLLVIVSEVLDVLVDGPEHDGLDMWNWSPLRRLFELAYGVDLSNTVTIYDAVTIIRENEN